MIAIAPKRQAGAAAFVFLALLPLIAFAQLGSDPNAGKNWDPIIGFADGNAVSDRTISGGRPSSVWSIARPLNANSSGGYENPATIGAIVFSRDGRQCGGMFRMVSC
jgi:hypothetical protein